MTAKTPAGLIRLDSGSPSFATPTHIVEAVKKAIDEGHTGYILEKGVMTLLEAICESIAAETGATIAPSQVLITNGSSSGIYTVMSCFLDPGDEVILPTPYYFNHEMAIVMANARPVLVGTDLCRHCRIYSDDDPPHLGKFAPAVGVDGLPVPNGADGHGLGLH